MRTVDAAIPLGGVALCDARTGDVVDLGGLTGTRALTLVRHRY